MKITPIILGLALAATLTAQTFIQMSDPQFGMYAKNEGFEHETANFEFAIATANRLKPAFIVVTGDLINQPENSAQAAEYKRVAAKLNPAIRLFNVAGNHDVGNEPTKETLARYRERFGPDYYTFRSGDIAGFVLNSSLEQHPQNAPEEAARMEEWLKKELAKARSEGVKHLIVFQHISFFLKAPDEADQYFNIPMTARQRYLKIFHDNGVQQVFAGHYHRNAQGRDGDLEMFTTGPVGMPLESAKSGMRIVTVTAAGVSQRYYDFGELPDSLNPPAK
ncbi:MAG TPA: metallophosphoesterase [Bryobacteraceae bacterium]|jgi:predicted phosphodiesterase